MKGNILDVTGKKKKQIDLPNCFNESIRADLIQKIIEAKKVWQPYSPSPVAGNQYSASGVLKHHRKVWKSQYGRGMSRIPRKQMSRRGSQFNWVGATVPNTRGGRRAHPPKAISMISLPNLNKKELKTALAGAIAATANSKLLIKRYASLKNKNYEKLPFIVESDFLKPKTKEVISELKAILPPELFKLAIKKRSIRKGIGKLRGRKYKKTAGLLLVIGNEENIKTTAFDVQKVNSLGVNDLANGGVARLTIYTEKAIKDLGEKFK